MRRNASLCQQHLKCKLGPFGSSQQGGRRRPYGPPFQFVHHMINAFPVSSDALLHSLLQRDVPGMTRNAIPILVDEGVQAITIGVNGGSAPPGVPKNMPFIWRDKPSGKEIITAVHPGRSTA